MASQELRQAVRALVFDQHDRVLLLHAPDVPGRADGLWLCPGGGIEPGETPHDAMIRELAEEVGLDINDRELHGPVWDRVAHGQQERYFAVRLTRMLTTDPPGDPWSRGVDGRQRFGWWSQDAIARATTAGAAFAPESLATLLADLPLTDLTGDGWSGPPRNLDR